MNDIKNVPQQPLDGCTAFLASITGNGQVTEVGEALRPGEFSAPRSLTRGFLLVRRDRTGIVSKVAVVLIQEVVTVYLGARLDAHRP